MCDGSGQSEGHTVESAKTTGVVVGEPAFGGQYKFARGLIPWKYQ